MPNKKDTIIVNGQLQAKKHLLLPKYKLYQLFKEKNYTYRYNFTTFRKEIPKNYVNLKLSQRHVCSKDYNLEQKLDTLNKLYQKVTVRELSNLSLCQYVEFPKWACLARECAKCGTEKIMEKYSREIEEDIHKQVKWYEWQVRPSSYTNKKGEVKEGKVWQQVLEKSSVPNLIERIAEEMKKHSMHLFRSMHKLAYILFLITLISI